METNSINLLPGDAKNNKELLNRIKNGIKPSAREVNLRIIGSDSKKAKPVHQIRVKDPKKTEYKNKKVKGILEMIGEENQDHVHLPYSIPYGNMWASCYFAMTGFHALHVFGGMVMFGIVLILGFMGRIGPQHGNYV